MSELLGACQLLLLRGVRRRAHDCKNLSFYLVEFSSLNPAAVPKLWPAHKISLTRYGVLIAEFLVHADAMRGNSAAVCTSDSLCLPVKYILLALAFSCHYKSISRDPPATVSETTKQFPTSSNCSRRVMFG
jgi:hypothetical protein